MNLLPVKLQIPDRVCLFLLPGILPVVLRADEVNPVSYACFLRNCFQQSTVTEPMLLNCRRWDGAKDPGCNPVPPEIPVDEVREELGHQ